MKKGEQQLLPTYIIAAKVGPTHTHRCTDTHTHSLTQQQLIMGLRAGSQKYATVSA